MNIRSALFIVAISIVTVLLDFDPANAAGYVITDLGTLGGSSSSAAAINDSQQVTGNSKIAGDTASHPYLYQGIALQDLAPVLGEGAWAQGINQLGHITGSNGTAFLYDGNSVTDLGTLGGPSSSGADINDAGEITGSSRISPTNNFTHAFFYDGATMHDLGTLGGDRSNGFGINSFGEVVGNSSMITGSFEVWHAFLYDGNSLRDLGTLGGDSAQAYAINDFGQVTGISDTVDDQTHAFLYEQGVMRDLGTLGGATSRASSINNDGHVVGSSQTLSGTSVAFLYDGSEMLNLCDLTDCGTKGWTRLETAIDINNSGCITGNGEINGETHAFLITWSEQPIAELCTDGIDNDDDGFSDCDDVEDCGQTTSCYVPAGMTYNLVDLGTLGGDYSSGLGVNNSGHVSGDSGTAGSDAVHAFSYDGNGLQDLGLLSPTDIDSHGNAINEGGQITGYSAARDFWGAADAKAFLYDNGSLVNLHPLLDAPCNLGSMGYGINDSGQVTGICYYEIDNTWGWKNGYAFLYDGNAMTVLGAISGDNSIGYGINNSAEVTGSTTTASGTHAFLYDGTLHDLGTLGGAYSVGSAINDLGQVTGRSTNADGATHAFFHDGSTMLDLGAFEGGISIGLGINVHGQIVGNSRLANGENAAFVFNDGHMLALCALTDCRARGWTALVSAADINDQGTITGYGVINGETRAFLASVALFDTDGDGVADHEDNCTLVANAPQRDTDGDSYGNYCDPDFDNNLVVNATDLAYFKVRFFGSDPNADLDGDGQVNAADLAILKAMFFQAPGPSGLVPE